MEIVPFSDFNNLQPLVPHEIQLEDLLGFHGNPEGFVDHNDPDNEIFNQNIHVGMVQIAQPAVDPIFESSPLLGPSPEAIRLWVKKFSQQSHSRPLVFIPDPWMNFFSFLLLQSPTFAWAKHFLQSSDWNYFGEEHNGNGSLFSLPNECPSVVLSSCPNFERTSSVVLELIDEDQENELDSPAKLSTPKKRKARTKGKAPISEEEVRRSTRLKKLNKGFKSTSCMDKNCLGCSSTPPTISSKVIRNLGATFCGINPADLTDQKLSAIPKKKVVVKKKVQKKTKSKSRSASDEEDASSPQ